MRPRRVAVLVLVLVALPRVAAATCSGAGLTWTCTSGSTAAQVNTAISSASDGATVTLADGSYSGAIALGPRNGVTVICASVRGCTHSGTFNINTTSTYTNLMRISGFIFSATSGTIIGLGRASGDPAIQRLRIDHNTFNNTSGESIATGHTSGVNSRLGSIDNNIFQGSTHNYVLTFLEGDENDWGASWQGTASNTFIEDNTFNYTNEALAASGMDMWRGGRMVIRFNAITNARSSVHGICHNGPANFESYLNTYTGGAGSSNGYRIVHHQGSGEIMVWGNTNATVSPDSSGITIQHYRSSNPNPEGCGTCNGSDGQDGNRSGQNGYPCYRQPGRTAGAVLKPMYFFKNILTGGALWTATITDAGGTSLLSSHLVDNRDYYETATTTVQTSPTSPFNGTSGIGVGTLANRPTTCTATAQAADAGQGGVGYWATDVGVWNRTLSGASGRLYRCSATNTWSVGYEPYAYPHPLRAAERGTPASPTNVRVGS